MEAVQTYRWTREAFEKLAEVGLIDPDARLELIDGEILQKMSPQSARHFTAVLKTEEALRTIFGPGYVVRVQGPLALGPYSEPEPDVAVVEGTIDDYVEAHPSTAVLVVEVADASLQFDRTRKAALYARAGIPEYWIVNLLDGVLEVHRRPEGDAYQQRMVLAPHEQIVPLARPGASLEVARLFPESRA
ncbi:Uma2 family endonuclease [Rhodothermus marinus]|uniref:Uma2 family endonuclease n=1 Tax=Rhodothermus marinus TaxID=29549 RepID=UPI001374D143